MAVKKRKRLSAPVRRKRPGALVRFLRRMPSWAVWVGAALVFLGYSWFFYYFFVGPFGFRWKAFYGDPNHPQGYDVYGIDISHYQDRIDWDVLASGGTVNDRPIRFVMVKATEGGDNVDPTFSRYFDEAGSRGFIRGAYHFWSRRSDARRQADNFIRNVRLETGDLPPILDVEDKARKQPDTEFRREVKAWLDIVERHYGVTPILYTNNKFKERYLNDTVFNRYPYWIAHYYVDSLTYKGPWQFWQYTDCGQVEGIKGRVDLNIFNGSLYDLKRQTIGFE